MVKTILRGDEDSVKFLQLIQVGRAVVLLLPAVAREAAGIDKFRDEQVRKLLKVR